MWWKRLSGDKVQEVFLNQPTSLSKSRFYKNQTLQAMNMFSIIIIISALQLCSKLCICDRCVLCKKVLFLNEKWFGQYEGKSALGKYSKTGYICKAIQL